MIKRFLIDTLLFLDLVINNSIKHLDTKLPVCFLTRGLSFGFNCSAPMDKT